MQRNRPSVKSQPLGATWRSMCQRCYGPKVKCYPGYGGRGITVFEEWRSDFWAFARYIEANLGPKPTPKHTLDRIKTNGNYEPGNLRWATQKEQLRNTRRTRIIEFRGESKCLTDWAEQIGVSKYCLRDRIVRLGWSVEKALTTPRQTDNF